MEERPTASLANLVNRTPVSEQHCRMMSRLYAHCGDYSKTFGNAPLANEERAMVLYFLALEAADESAP